MIPPELTQTVTELRRRSPANSSRRHKGITGTFETAARTNCLRLPLFNGVCAASAARSRSLPSASSTSSSPSIVARTNSIFTSSGQRPATVAHSAHTPLPRQPTRSDTAVLGVQQGGSGLGGLGPSLAPRTAAVSIEATRPQRTRSRATRRAASASEAARSNAGDAKVSFAEASAEAPWCSEARRRHSLRGASRAFWRRGESSRRATWETPLPAGSMGVRSHRAAKSPPKAACPPAR
mmetsp:Transcript_60446/g.136638  ORF Transcript_60446/g.136638 Transcript_60446/m.136638 type:complete len:237 (+) Transcript_60446:1197-1907(+)